MSSNEHPDMHGCWMDEPFTCHHCEREFKEGDAYGVPYSDEMLFCSAECVESFEESQLDSFYGLNDCENLP